LQFQPKLYFGDVAAERLAEELETPVDVESFEQGLLERGIFAKIEGGDVDEGFVINHVLEKGGEFAGVVFGELGFQADEPGQLGAEPFVFGQRRAGFARESANTDTAIRIIADDPGNFRSAETLKQEIGSAVLVFLAGADDADADDTMLGLDGPGLAKEALIEAGDGKNAIGREDVAEHLPITRFEDMQREQRLREESDVGQGHNRDFVGDRDFRFHGGILGAIFEKDNRDADCVTGGTQADDKRDRMAGDLRIG